LRAVHTPGHAPDHLCFDLDGSGVLFSGDHVMGWNTTMVAPPEGHMGDYIASLEKLIAGRAERHAIYLSGHGDTIHEPHRLVRSYLLHRQMREAMILECVQTGIGTVNEITDRVYRNVAAAVLSAAKLSVLAHLERLLERELVSCDGAPSLLQTFRPAS
jgi:glyoxylase-like metal-dependent hydrolase (beta-lactamase superfamily II)